MRHSGPKRVWARSTSLNGRDSLSLRVLCTLGELARKLVAVRGTEPQRKACERVVAS